MKNILLLTVLLACSFYGYSQAGKWGVRGGFNISNLDFDGNSAPNNDHRNSVFIGFTVDYNLSQTISLAPEIQFSAEGANEEFLNLDYLQVPILIKFKLSEKFYLGVGPQVGLKINKVDDGIRNFAYSGVGGLEYKLNYALFVDARYTYGFSNIFDENLGIKATNSNIQLGVGYKF